MIEIEKLTDIDWVKNGDTLSGVYSILDFKGGNLDPFEYQYGINRPYVSLINNDKKILNGLKDVAEKWQTTDFSEEIVVGGSISFQFVPDLSKGPTDASMLLYPWKSIKNGDYCGISFSELEQSNIMTDPRNCISPGLDGSGAELSIRDLNSKYALIQVKIGVRPFACSHEADIKNKFAMVSQSEYLLKLPVTYKSPTILTYDPGHGVQGDKIWIPITDGCAFMHSSSFILDVEKFNKVVYDTARRRKLEIYYTFDGSFSKYAALNYVDIDIFPLINRF